MKAAPGAGNPSASLTPMGSHAIPRHPVSGQRRRAVAAERALAGGRKGARFAGAEGSRGSLPLSFHPSLRRQGPRLDPRAVPAGSGEGWLRGRLRLSVARSAGARLRGARSSWRRSMRFSLRCRPGRPRGTRSRPRFWARARSCAWMRKGRVSLDERLKGSLGLSDEAVFVGQGHKFQIWAPSRFQSHLDKSRLQVRRLRAERGAGPARMTEPGPRHIPVLIAEVLEALAPREGGADRRRHFRRRRLYARASRSGRQRGRARPRSRGHSRRRRTSSRLPAAGCVSIEARFGDMERVASGLGLSAVDGVVLDVGVSSMQLDEAERGFSLRFDAPLDMRMGRRAAPPPTSCATRTRRRSPTFSSISARSAPPAESRAPSSRTARRRPSSRRWSSPG